ncbi:hypothetical protein ACH414_27930 [Streptomyces sp. NPDC020422]|uniref:hypothetical protein n=1 Tax=Streptomyces sp. NPDC020422 TaxID=3365074 RepID=UPI0037B5DCA4
MTTTTASAPDGPRASRPAPTSAPAAAAVSSWTTRVTRTGRRAAAGSCPAGSYGKVSTAHSTSRTGSVPGGIGAYSGRKARARTCPPPHTSRTSAVAVSMTASVLRA